MSLREPCVKIICVVQEQWHFFIRASPKAGPDMFGNCIHGVQRFLAAAQWRRRSSYSVDTQSAAYASLCDVIREGWSYLLTLRSKCTWVFSFSLSSI